MNASKCCFTFFSKSGKGSHNLHLFPTLNGKPIPFKPNPVFLGIMFVETKKLSFKQKNSDKCIYSALIGSIFNYSFFTVSSVAKSNLDLIHTLQNMCIRCIYMLKWDSPTKELFLLSGILPLKSRFYQLGARFLTKIIRFNNHYICRQVKEYFRSW